MNVFGGRKKRKLLGSSTRQTQEVSSSRKEERAHTRAPSLLPFSLARVRNFWAHSSCESRTPFLLFASCEPRGRERDQGPLSFVRALLTWGLGDANRPSLSQTPLPRSSLSSSYLSDFYRRVVSAPNPLNSNQIESERFDGSETSHDSLFRGTGEKNEKKKKKKKTETR